MKVPKRKWPFFAVAVILMSVFGILKFGVQLGSVHLGKQTDLLTGQKFDIENSNFYSDVYNTDSLLVLNFWATWCKPCIAEIPVLNQVKRQYEREKIAFVSFSMDSDSLKLIEFLSSGRFEFRDLTLENLHYRTAILNTVRGKVPEEWIGSYSLPLTYIIRNKQVVHVMEGELQKDSLVAAIERNR